MLYYLLPLQARLYITPNTHIYTHTPHIHIRPYLNRCVCVCRELVLASYKVDLVRELWGSENLMASFFFFCFMRGPTVSLIWTFSGQIMGILIRWFSRYVVLLKYIISAKNWVWNRVVYKHVQAIARTVFELMQTNKNRKTIWYYYYILSCLKIYAVQ